VIRVLTLNIWNEWGDWPARREVLRAGLRELAPDVIALQETVVRDGVDQVAELLDDGYHVLHSENRDRGGQGVSIASRWPIGAGRELDLGLTERARASDFVATTLLAVIEGPQRLLFVNHFPHYQPALEYERELEAVAAVRAIEQVAAPDDHVIMAGDMDADPDAASIRYFSGRQSLQATSVCFVDTWAACHRGAATGGETFTETNGAMNAEGWPFQRIDYVFVRCGPDGMPTLRVAECHRVFDRPVGGVWPSDHFGVLAVLEPR
jgi:endonuclease/exonuclease/phosphatase family metal-dependent hydrolase